MNTKERKKALEFIEGLRALIMLDERKQDAKGGGSRSSNRTPEHMAQLRQKADEKRLADKRAKLIAELQAVEDAMTKPEGG